MTRVPLKRRHPPGCNAGRAVTTVPQKSMPPPWCRARQGVTMVPPARVYDASTRVWSGMSGDHGATENIMGVVLLGKMGW